MFDGHKINLDIAKEDSYQFWQGDLGKGALYLTGCIVDRLQ